MKELVAIGFVGVVFLLLFGIVELWCIQSKLAEIKNYSPLAASLRIA